jgi:CxxC motif-containing protein
MEVSVEGEEIKVAGNLCPKGVDFAKAEMTAPMRSLTTTVATSFPDSPRLPVKTRGEIPKGKMMEAMAKIRTVVVSEPKQVGDVILPDLFGTDVVATGVLAG